MKPSNQATSSNYHDCFKKNQSSLSSSLIITSSSSKNDNHDHLWDALNDVLMEAMILLDPPPATPLSTTTTTTTATSPTSSLTLASVQASYDMLVSFSNYDYFHKEMMSIPSIVNSKNTQQQQKQKQQQIQHKQPEEEANTSFYDSSYTFHDKIILLSDLYRAIIVSSSLLLELMIPPIITKPKNSQKSEDERIDATTTNNDAYGSTTRMLCQTIQRSILLLQRISQIYFLATSKYQKSTTMSSSSTSSLSSSYLPKNMNDKKHIILSMMKPYQYQPTTTTKSNNVKVNDDNDVIVEWHDTLLPKSQHPLLQECFERKELIDLETDVIFGYDDRLISLLLEDYEYYSSTTTNDYDCDNNDMEDPKDDSNSVAQKIVNDNSTNDNDSYHHQPQEQQQQKQQRNSSSQDDDISQHLSLSLNIKEIEKEEEMLLNVAFPDTYNEQSSSQKKIKKQKDGKNSRKRRRRNQEDFNNKRLSHQFTRLTSNFLDICQKNDVLKYIQLPFTSGKEKETYPIVKEGWLLLRHSSPSSSSRNPTKNQDDNMTKYYIRIFKNGIIILCSSMDESKHSSAPTNMSQEEKFMVYELVVGEDIDVPKKCTSIIRNNIFHFQIESVRKLYSTTKSDANTSTSTDGSDDQKYDVSISTIEFAIDRKHGGNYLMEGWEWISVLDECLEIKAATHCLHKTIELFWT